MVEAKRYCVNHSSALVLSTEKPTDVSIHALCLSLKLSHLDLDTFKYYVCLCNELELVWTGGTNFFFVSISFYLGVLQESTLCQRVDRRFPSGACVV